MVGPVTTAYQTFGGTTVNMVTNQLHAIGGNIQENMRPYIEDLCLVLVREHQQQEIHKQKLDQGAGTVEDRSVKHTAYRVQVTWSDIFLY